ncbi:MAG: S-malonyltransferase [Firmicutes bacterium]|nr:S-malonyltransferase [Bacillota bacterium]
MGKIAFIFSGQGAQYVGMGKELYDSIPVCKEVFDKADEALGFSISKICFEGPEEELGKTENTQPAILTMSIAAMKALEEEGIFPDYTAGLSLGEYSALVCSGAFDFEDAVKLIKKRGKFMQEAVPAGVGAMAAIIGLKEEVLREVLAKSAHAGLVEAANFNCPGQIVIAGEVKAVETAVNNAKEAGAMMAVMLNVSGPFHTSMMEPAAVKLEKELAAMLVKDMKIPIITNVTGEFVENSADIKAALKKQVMSSVLWEKTINTMLEAGVDTFVEIGPGKALCGFVKKINRKVTAINVENVDSLQKAINKIKEVEQ